MEILKDHYEKVIFGSVLAILVWALLGVKSDIAESRTKSDGYIIDQSFADENKQNIKTVDSSTLIDYSQVKAPEGVGIKTPTNRIMEVNRYIVCSNSECQHIIPFETKDCPICKTNQGLSRKETKLREDALKDDDQDGIINGVEDHFSFLDRNNKYDAFLDYDKNGFANIQEINGNLSLEEIKANFIAGKFSVYDPADPNSHPELATLLRVKSNNQAKDMGITLKSISEEGKEKSSWLIAFNSTKTGKVRTLWRRIGEEVVTNTDLKLTIEDISKNTIKTYKKTLKAYVTDVIYTVTLKSIDGEFYQVKKNEFLKQGSKSVQFVYLNHHSSNRLTEYEVKHGDKFELPLVVNGKISRKETFVLGKATKDVVKIKRLNDGKIFDIEKHSSQDSKMTRERGRAVKASVPQKQ